MEARVLRHGRDLGHSFLALRKPVAFIAACGLVIVACLLALFLHFCR